MFDRVVCIALSRCPERFEKFKSDQPADWPFGPVERVEAIDGRRCPPPDWFEPGVAAWGCNKSHEAVLQDALNCGVDSILIFEDDAFPLPHDLAGAWHRFVDDVPPDWDILFLGGQHAPAGAELERVSDSCFRCRDVRRAHAWALKRRGMLSAYHWLNTTHQASGRAQIHDNFMATRQADSGLNIYCPAHWLFGQRAGYSEIKTRALEDRTWPDAATIHTSQTRRPSRIARKVDLPDVRPEASPAEPPQSIFVPGASTLQASECSIVVTCKGRLAHLRQTIDRMLQQGAGEVVLVDYECPDHCGDEFADRAKVVRPLALRPPYFNASHARNCGAVAAVGKALAFVDADVMLDANWLAHCVDLLNEKRAVLVRRPRSRSNWDIFGTCLVTRDAFLAARGYRETVDSWGHEDVDLFDRLAMVGPVVFDDAPVMRAIEHDDVTRLAHYPETVLGQSSRRMRERIRVERGMVNPEGFGRLEPLARGVVTGADDNYFPGIQLLVESIRETEPWPIRVVDLGMKPSQREWCQTHAVQVLDGDTVLPHEILLKFEDGTFGGIRRRRMLWPRPWLMAASPFRDTLWIDADAVVTKPLGELFDRLADGIQVFPDPNDPKSSLNKPALYRFLPVPGGPTAKHVNSGVVGVRQGRDDDLLDSWRYCVEKAAENPRIRHAISWYDQGCLLWALHATGRTGQICEDNRWNAVPHGYATGRSNQRRWYGGDVLSQVRRDNPSSGIVHYLARPKLWQRIYPALAVIACCGRTGSSMLQFALDSHPQARWFGELNNHDVTKHDLSGAKSQAAIEYFESQGWQAAGQPEGLRSIGFKLRLERPGVEAVAANHDVRVLLLRRRDLLRQIASERVGIALMSFDSRRPRPEGLEPAFRATGKWLQGEFERVERYYEQAERIFAEHQTLAIDYESLLDSPAVWSTVLDFLGLDPAPWRPRTVRQEHRPIEDIFLNFAELATFFSNTRWRWMFTERRGQALTRRG